MNRTLCMLAKPYGQIVFELPTPLGGSRDGVLRQPVPREWPDSTLPLMRHDATGQRGACQLLGADTLDKKDLIWPDLAVRMPLDQHKQGIQAFPAYLLQGRFYAASALGIITRGLISTRVLIHPHFPFFSCRSPTILPVSQRIDSSFKPVY